jgi:hypothetical protein
LAIGSVRNTGIRESQQKLLLCSLTEPLSTLSTFYDLKPRSLKGTRRVLERFGEAASTFEAKHRNAIEKMGVVLSVLIYCKLRHG